MKAAVSTACLYPKLTEDALYDLCLSGINRVEIFLNAPSETGSVFANDMAAMLRRFEVRCVSVQDMGWQRPIRSGPTCGGGCRRARRDC